MKSQGIPSATGISNPNEGAAARARLPRPVREQQMLEAASELFGEQGYRAVSMDQIADVVGISKPMLYAYFDSKEGLCTACIKRAGADAINAISGSYRPGLSPEESLWAGFIAFFEFVRQQPQSWRLIRSESTYDVELFQQMVAEIHDDMRAVIQELERMASSETTADPFAEPELRAAASFALFGAVTAMANRWLEGGFTADPEVYATELMNFFWVGMRQLAEGESWVAPARSA